MCTMKTTKAALTTIFYCLLMANVMSQSASNEERQRQKKEVESILLAFVNDYKSDRHATEPRTVGIEVPEVNGAWTIRVTGKEVAPKEWEVALTEGLPSTPTYAYRAEVNALKAIYNGEMNAMTAQAKAFSTDYAPLEAIEINGYRPTEVDDSAMNAFSFHFWTRGFPEVIPFRPDATRRAHGGSVTVFYYEKGLRTGWYNILPGEIVREDAREQAMPFPMMGVVIKGTAKGVVDGEPITVTEGNTVFIPANVHHKWWNEGDESVELILIMFGEGA